MIPRIIHYCWFGRGEMPQLAKYCIASWHKYMPDWEYKLWNEDNFDVNSVPYVKEAYAAKKFAFVTDYVRLYALYTEGGVYMDTDVEVLKSFEPLLNLSGFIGFEGSKTKPIGTGTIACERGNVWAKSQMDEYVGIHFYKNDGTYDTTTNPIRITNSMKNKGFVANGLYSIFDDMHIFPTDYFCPRQTTGELFITENTYCDHHFMGTWNEEKREVPFLIRLVGPGYATKLIKLKRKLIG